MDGHGRACRQSISNQIGTSRIPVNKSIVLKGQKGVLTHPGVGLRVKYWIYIFLFLFVIKEYKL